MNNVQNEHSRSKAILSTIGEEVIYHNFHICSHKFFSYMLERDPSAFRPKVVSKDIEKAHKKGCNCKRSNCLKK